MYKYIQDTITKTGFQPSKNQRAREMDSEEVSPFHGDTLEAILSHVGIPDLLRLALVNGAWNKAAISVLGQALADCKPWLLLHRHSRRRPYESTVHAYDPYSRSWIRLPHSQPSLDSYRFRSSQSNLLYTLSPSRIAFSIDPLKQQWHHTGGEGMQVWRMHPVVATFESESSTKVVVIGGTYDFEDDPLSVEIFDSSIQRWETCDSLPETFRGRASASWLSAAICHKIHILDKNSGLFCSFDPDTKKWGTLAVIFSEPAVFESMIVWVGDKIILVGLLGEATNVSSVGIWEVNCEGNECRLIGESPPQICRETFPSEAGAMGFDCIAANGLIYVYNPCMWGQILTCDVSGAGCKWGVIEKSDLEGEGMELDSWVFTCSSVGIEDLIKVFEIKRR
ncbi:F-box/kelch-repeat protein At1g23390 [Amborella trichopoda]|nr:F-box/kelch-repeat protein At1g23390 [Amborella trichopoda]|eukprot:XP_006840661.2 F-box/kelch-repeat protein At1g23390 [Amborella trichopoda]